MRDAATTTQQGALKGQISGLVLDMDGVLFRGERALPGAQELFPALRAAGLSYILLTNNSTLTPESFAAKLARMGIQVDPDSIVTSAVATALYLRRQYPDGGGVYVMGEEGLVRTISSAPGFRLDAWQPDFVVVGLFFGFDYNSLQRACRAIRNGAKFIATNADLTLPVEGGELWPGAGSIVAAVQACSGVEPVVIGKPNVEVAELVLDFLGMPREQVLCVGDRLDTDILLGERAGMPTALVLTGVSSEQEALSAEARPNYIFKDLPELMAALGL